MNEINDILICKCKTIDNSEGKRKIHQDCKCQAPSRKEREFSRVILEDNGVN